MTMVNKERLSAGFIELCEIESPSRKEGKICARLKEIFTQMGAEQILEDSSAEVTGSDCGNIVIRFPGTLPEPPLFFSCHMDTVGPTSGIQVAFKDGLFTSAGETILGSDDKSGLIACIEAMQVIKEQGLAHRSVEFVITTCEELGLVGVKAMDFSMIQAKQGFALDSSGAGRVLTHAPAANRLIITIQGVAAHAGLHPEWGVNSILLAAQALRALPNGRLDYETTANIGTITGGVAVNIVPEQVIIRGEVRSHSREKLAHVTQQIEDIFKAVVEKWTDPTGQAKGSPLMSFVAHEDYPAMALKPNCEVLTLVSRAGEKVGMDLTYEQAGGGSDANIFNKKGLETAIIATGMTNVHSTDECVLLQDMVDLTDLLIAIITDQAE